MSACKLACQILYYPHPGLRLKAEPVLSVDRNIQSFVDDMLKTMYKSRLIGLAATQVNVQQRIVVMDVSDTWDKPQILINPEITERRGEQEMDGEGCSSFPGVYTKLKRAAFVHVKALDRDGKPFEFDATNLAAVCVQHEVDHLDGKLFIDYLSRLKREILLKKLEKIQRRRM